MKHVVKLGAAWLKGLCAVVLLSASAKAGNPYLPLIGPPPLRIQVIKVPASPAKFTVTPALTNVPPPVDSKPASAVTNAPVAVAPVTMVSESPNGALGDTFTSSVFPIPTPDLLGITPQMLATYFHPVQTGSNSIAPNGSYPVIFMPPMPPDKSSHAEYIVK